MVGRTLALPLAPQFRTQSETPQPPRGPLRRRAGLARKTRPHRQRRRIHPANSRLARICPRHLLATDAQLSRAQRSRGLTTATLFLLDWRHRDELSPHRLTPDARPRLRPSYSKTHGHGPLFSAPRRSPTRNPRVVSRRLCGRGRMGRTPQYTRHVPIR